MMQIRKDSLTIRKHFLIDLFGDDSISQEGRERDALEAYEATRPTGDQPPDLQLVG